MKLKVGEKYKLISYDELKDAMDTSFDIFFEFWNSLEPYQEPNDEPTQKEIMEFYKRAMQDCQIPTGDLAHMNATEFYKKYHKSNNHQITETYKQALSDVSGRTVTSKASNKEPNDDLVKDNIKDYGDDDLENRIVELSEQIKNIKKRADETLDFAISNITKQNKRITALEQLQPTTTCDSIKISGGKHPDANDNQPTVKNCVDCKYFGVKNGCYSIVGYCGSNYSKWEQA